MKKIVCMVSVLLICALFLGAVAEQAEEAATYGNAGEIGGWIATYCSEWNDIFGSAFGSDMSYDTGNLTFIEKRANDATVDIDGIIVDMDYDLNVLSMRVNLSDASRDMYANLVRCLAIVAVLCYDTPTDREGMKDMFMGLMERYLDGLEFHNSRAYLYPEGGFSDMAIFLNVVKGSAIFYFCSTDGNLYFSTNDLVE